MELRQDFEGRHSSVQLFALNYIATLFWITLCFAVYHFVSFYQSFLSPLAVHILYVVGFSYALFYPFYYFFFLRKSRNFLWRVVHYGYSKSVLALMFVWHLFWRIFGRRDRVDSSERTAFLFILVKFFFLPLMVQFMISNFTVLRGTSVSEWYGFGLILLFSIDTLVFTLGYLVESSVFGNVVRSVEFTFFGWAVALICYPPFNSLVGKYVPWGARDMFSFSSEWVTFVARVVVLLLLCVYVWATLALGTKASNLTNRGIVSRGPYRFVRHPAYISKVSLWWITLFPLLSWPYFFGMLFWTVVYLFRALTEERHLSFDADYVEYKKKVKWRFIPGVI